MNAAESPKPRGSWSFIVNALADLGARELERRAKAQHNADTTREDDAQAQPDQPHDENEAARA